MRTSFSPVIRRGKAVSGDVLKVGPKEREGSLYPHQKCDAKTPCTACLNWDRGVGCRYEPRKRSRFTRINATSISRENTPGPTSSNNLPPKTSADGLSEPLINPASDRLLTRSDSSESAVSLSLSLVPYSEQSSTSTERHPRDLSTHLYDETVSYISSDVSVVQKHPGTTKCAPRLAVSSFTILPSIHFRIPRPLQIPLSLIPPEHVQVSYIAGNDLDMFLYVFLWLLNPPGRGD